MRTSIPWCHANNCKHILDLVEGRLTCKAFPAGIPKEILVGKVEHVEAYPGDGGIRFEREDGRPPFVHFLEKE